MQKSLLAVATATAFLAGTVQAADLQIYGTVDTGLTYVHESSEIKQGGVKTYDESDNSWGLESGLNTSSVFGIVGSEQITETLTVGFQLENSFASDSGAFDDPDRLFDKESRLYVTGTLGTLSFGRMGALNAGEGTYDLFMLTGDTMDGDYSDYIGAGYWLDRGIYDNTITYQSPEFAGLTLYAQYSNGLDGDDSVSSRDKDRYAAVGLGYTAGNLSMALVVDTVMKNRSFDTVYVKDVDDATSVSLGINYDFGFMKPFFGIQYGQHEDTFAGADFSDYAVDFGDFDGYSVAVGSAFPIWGGELQVSAYYSDGDGDVYAAQVSENNVGIGVDLKRYGVGVLHSYELSKRTSLYAGAGYSHQEADVKSMQYEEEFDAFQVIAGLVHNF